jgi:hypothetical protein
MNINKIIDDEIKSINENYSFTNGQFAFTQPIAQSHFFNYDNISSEYESDINDSSIVLSWGVGFNPDEEGIGLMKIVINGLTGTFDLELRDKNSDELISSTKKNINEYKWKYVIGGATLQNGGTLYAADLQFDFKNNTCIVGFN